MSKAGWPRGKGKVLYEMTKDRKDGITETIVVTQHDNGLNTEIFYKDSEGKIKLTRGHFIWTEYDKV